MDFKEKYAIVLSDCGNIKSVLTHRDIRKISDLIIKFISKNVGNNKLCIGLKMTHNIYIPAIVLSLQELQNPFIFLPENTAEMLSIVDELGIVWLLSFESFKDWFAKVSINNDDLFLEKIPNVQSKNYENISYIIRTSGTTSRNKFVKVNKFCIQSNISSFTRIFEITDKDVIYFGTPLTFDPSMIELSLALHNGACLLITPPKIRLNTSLLYQTLFHPQNGITVLQMVPSLFLRWTDEQICSILTFPLLRILAFGGEPFPQIVLNRERSSNLRVFNVYGITEVSCWASVCEISSNNEDAVSIGNALDDTVIEVRDDYGNEITDGEGEIYIGSSSRICLVDDEQAVESPVFRPTGDIGIVINKKIYYKGRKNDVFKRFGHRLYLSKIEEMMLKYTGLENKCVWSKKHSKLLVFFIMDQYDNGSKDKVIDKIRVKLLHTLPKHCFPDYIDIIPRCPITVHGKIDKNALEDIYLNQDKRYKNRNCLDTFRSLLCKYFGLGRCHVDEMAELKFFDIGGNSVLAVQLLNEFSDQLDVEPPPELVTALFENNLRSCFECLKTAKLTRKRAQTKEDGESSKRIKKQMELKIAWFYNLHACVDSSPLVFHDGHQILVAIGSFSHIFSVIDGTVGSEISKFVLPDIIESLPCLSPCGNFLCIGCFDGKMYCLDWRNTKIKWAYATDDRIKCSPILCQKSKAIVFGSYDKYVHCVNIDNGVFVWKTLVSESLISTPLLHDENIFIATICGTCLCLSETNGDILWSYKSGNPIFGSPCFYQDSVIWPNVQGKVICLKHTGEKNWEYECRGHLYSSMVIYEDLVIFGSQGGNLYFLKVGDDAELKTSVNLGDNISSTPCIGKVKGKECVFAATDSGTLFSVDFEGFIIGQIKLPGQIFSSVRLWDGRLYVGCRDNNLYCISYC